MGTAMQNCVGLGLMTNTCPNCAVSIELPKPASEPRDPQWRFYCPSCGERIRLSRVEANGKQCLLRRTIKRIECGLRMLITQDKAAAADEAAGRHRQVRREYLLFSIMLLINIVALLAQVLLPFLAKQM